MIRAAVALLTRFPAAAPRLDASGAGAFPLVGAVIGAAGGLCCLLLAPAEPALAAIAAIVVMAICSGGLHLDGLADTFDALAATDGDAAERARKDPALGPTGATALIAVLAAQVAALASLAGREEGPQLAAAACVTAAALGRMMPVAVARLLGGRRPAHDGFGSWFTARVTGPDVITAALSSAAIMVAVAALTGEPASAGGALAGIVVGGLAVAAIVTARGRLDGDGFGAGIELTVTATLVATALLV